MKKLYGLVAFALLLIVISYYLTATKGGLISRIKINAKLGKYDQTNPDIRYYTSEDWEFVYDLPFEDIKEILRTGQTDNPNT